MYYYAAIYSPQCRTAGLLVVLPSVCNVWANNSKTKKLTKPKQESPANAKGTRDSSACMKAHCEQM